MKTLPLIKRTHLICFWAMMAVFRAVYSPIEPAAAQEVEVVPQTGHSGPITAVKFSPKGDIIATGGGDGKILLRDLTTLRTVRIITSTQSNVNCLAFTPDAKILASAGTSSIVHIWDVASGSEIFALHTGHVNPISSLTFSPDGDTLITTSLDKTVRLFQRKGWQPLPVMPGHIWPVYCLDFSPDGKQFVTGGNGRAIRTWDTTTGHSSLFATIAASDARAVVFTGDGHHILCGDDQGVLTLFDSTTGATQRTWAGDGHGITSISYDSTRDLFSISEQESDSVQIGNPLSDQFPQWMRYSNLRSATLSSDGRFIAAVSSNNALSLRDVRDVNAVLLTAPELTTGIVSIALSPDGKTLASGGSNDAAITLWDISTGQVRQSLQQEVKPTNRIIRMVYSPDGEHLYTTLGSDTMEYDDYSITDWDTVNQKPHRKLEGSSLYVQALAVSSNNKILASGCNDGTVRFWDVASGKYLNQIKVDSNPVYSVAFDKSGTSLITGSFNPPVRVWDVATGTHLYDLGGQRNSIRAVAVSPAGEFIASGANDTSVWVWNSVTHHPIATLKAGSGNVHSVCFSQDGSFLAASNLDEGITIWSVPEFKEYASYKVHSGWIHSLVFTKDSKKLISCSLDGAVEIYNVPAKQVEASLISLADSPNDSVTFTPSHFYQSSRRALQAVAFRIDNQVFPMEQFDLRLNRPDKVLQALGNTNTRLIRAYYEAYLKRLNKMNVTEDMFASDFHLPELSITDKSIPLSVPDFRFSVPIQASDAKPSITLDRINVWVNGVPANATILGSGNSPKIAQSFAGSAGYSLRQSNISRFRGTITIPLSVGRNKVEVSCLNSAGAESLKQTFYIQYKPLIAQLKPNLYIVAIGVSHYAQPPHDLSYAAKDAGDLINCLREEHGADSNYNHVYSLPLTDNSAKSDEILAKTSDFLKETTVNDVVIMFLAGHGMLDSNLDYYFAPHDMDFNAPTKRGLSYGTIEGLVDGIPARKKLLLIDTCHAGEVDKATTEALMAPDGLASGVKPIRAAPGKSYIGLSNSFQLMQELFADLRRSSGATVIAAASGIQFAYEDGNSNGGNGLFTHALLEGMKKGAGGKAQADTNGDGHVSVEELRKWILKLVPQLSNGRQTPIARRENLEEDWSIN